MSITDVTSSGVGTKTLMESLDKLNPSGSVIPQLTPVSLLYPVHECDGNRLLDRAASFHRTI